MINPKTITHQIIRDQDAITAWPRHLGDVQLRQLTAELQGAIDATPDPERAVFVALRQLCLTVLDEREAGGVCQACGAEWSDDEARDDGCKSCGAYE